MTKIYFLAKLNCKDQFNNLLQRLNVKDVRNYENLIIFQKDIKTEQEVIAHIRMIGNLLVDNYCFLLQYSLKIIDESYCSNAILDEMDRLSHNFPTAFFHITRDGNCDLSYDYRTKIPESDKK